MTRPAYLEVLESRIAPALVLVNPLPDIIVGAGTSGKAIELSQMFDPLLDHPGHTIVTFTLNFDTDPNTAGLQPAKISIELFDNEAPLTVQNFLRYATEENSAYLNTFLHRLFDFQSSSEAGMDIIQGGGFPVSDIDEHIDTLGQVHNEYNEARQNTRGTIAMAKTALGPDTATSEWFINLNNNSSILGKDNNSGFTVFGQIIEGMDVLDKIAKLPKTSLGGALTDLPVQNLDPDPDNNPGTPGPKPGENNFITITDVSVEAPKPGNVENIAYDWEVVPAQGTPGVIKNPLADIIDGRLMLEFDPTKNGVATIRVTATRDGEAPVIEEFTVTLRPNLMGVVTNDSLTSILLPGEGGKATVKVQNNGGANFIGDVVIKFYLSARNTADAEGTKLDDTDILIGSVAKANLSLFAFGAGTPDETEISMDNLALPKTLLEGRFEDYRLIVKIEAAAGTPEQLFTDDDVAVDGGVHLLTNQFGTIDFSTNGFGKRTNATLEYLDPQTGKLVSLSMKGNGNGLVMLDKRKADITTDDQAELFISGTNSRSQLKIDAADDAVTFSNVEIANFMGLVDLTNVHRLGSVALSGGAKTVIFGDFNEIPGDTRLTIGTPLTNEQVTIKLGRVRDLTIESNQAIKSIQAIDWHDTLNPDNSILGSDDKISAPSIGSIKITGDKKTSIVGDFEANIQTYPGGKLPNITVAGSIIGAKINAFGDIGKIKAAALDDAEITTTGKISNLSITGKIDGSTIDANGSISKITAAELLNSEVSSDTGISNLSISTDVTGSTIDLSGTLGKFKSGTLTDSEIIGDKLSNIVVAKLVSDTTIRSRGDIGTVTVGGLIRSNVFAGVDERPDALTDFDSVQTIKSITVKGLSDVPNTFVDSQVAASNISKIVVRGGVDPTTGDSPFGFVADKVGKYSRTGGLKDSKLDDAATLDVTGDYQLLILAPVAAT